MAPNEGRMAKPTVDATPAARGKCPICGAPTEHATRPFCSRVCADVDLSRWLRGAYVIASVDQDDDEDGDGHDRAPEPPPSDPKRYS